MKLKTGYIFLIITLLFSILPTCLSVDKAFVCFSEAGAANELTLQTNFTTTAENTMSISCPSSFSGIYIIWKTVPGEWSLNADGKVVIFGRNGFLHEYVSLETPCREAAITVEGTLEIKEIYTFSAGNLPSWVQVWQPPCERADIMLCSTHADDEHLFFLGVLPYYAGELGLNVQVTYFVNHNDTESRPHELLNGLWTVGVTAYPVIGEAPDLYSSSLEEALEGFADYGFNENMFIEFQVEMLRRFKPLIVIGHDVNGEYSHGAHILNSATLRKALDLSMDPDKYRESYEKYGAWDVPKTYLHLWHENTIYIDWDFPLERFHSKTAFQVSQAGYDCHESQHWTWFSKWIGLKPDWGVTKAADIKEHSPCKYGLYRSAVGPDIQKKDFLENITLYEDKPEPAPTFLPEKTVKPNETAQSSVTEPPKSAPSGGNETAEKHRSGLFLSCLLLAGAAAFAALAALILRGCIIKYRRRKF